MVSASLILANSIVGILPAVICFAFLIATCIPFICASRFNSHGIKKLIRATILFYFAFYLMQTLLIGLDGISNNYSIIQYDSRYDIILDTVVITFHILAHIIFYLYLLERILILFEGTQFALNRCNLRILIIVAIHIELYHFAMHIVFEYDLFKHYNADWHLHEILLAVFVIMNTLFGLTLIGLFVNKLFKIIVNQRESISASTLLKSERDKELDIIREQELSNDEMQRNIMYTITKNCVLIIQAVLWRNVAIVCLSIILHDEERQLSWPGVYVLIGYNVAVLCELTSIYLTFSFAAKIYKVVCVPIHRCCYRLCLRLAKKETIKADHVKIDSYVALTDFDRDYYL